VFWFNTTGIGSVRMLSNSTLEGNAAKFGAILFAPNAGQLAILDSTLVYNSASAGGVGFFTDALTNTSLICSNCVTLNTAHYGKTQAAGTSSIYPPYIVLISVANCQRRPI